MAVAKWTHLITSKFYLSAQCHLPLQPDFELQNMLNCCVSWHEDTGAINECTDRRLGSKMNA